MIYIPKKKLYIPEMLCSPGEGNLTRSLGIGRTKSGTVTDAGAPDRFSELIRRKTGTLTDAGAFTKRGELKRRQTGVGTSAGAYSYVKSAAGAPSYITDANCQGAWLFADDLTDETSKANDLTQGGTVAYSATIPYSSGSGKSLSLDGSTNYAYRLDTNLSANFPFKLNYSLSKASGGRGGALQDGWVRRHLAAG